VEDYHDILDKKTTFTQISAFYFWHGMQKLIVKIFVERCRVCHYAKGRSQNTEVYRPLPIPSRPWDYVNMEFVLVLPRAHKGNDSIYVVVDRSSKNSTFDSLHKDE
jgi:hypothetical protein